MGTEQRWVDDARRRFPNATEEQAARYALQLKQSDALKQWKFQRLKQRQALREETLSWTEAQAWRIATFPVDHSDVVELPETTQFTLSAGGGAGYSTGGDVSVVLREDERVVDRAEFVAFHQDIQRTQVEEMVAEARRVRPDQFAPADQLTDADLKPALRSAGLKLKRAHDHLNALHEHFRAYGETNRILLTESPEGQPDSKGQIPYIVKFDPVPDDVALAIGDVATNARAVLDHLAWGVSDHTQREAEKQNVKFPFVESSNTNNPGGPPSRRYRNAMPGAHSDAHILAESFQCFDVNDAQHRPDLIAWEWLHTIVNGDKHRTVTVMKSVARNLAVRTRSGARLMAGLGGTESGHEVHLPPLVTDGNGNFAGHAACDVTLKEVAYRAPSSFYSPGGRWPVETTVEMVLMKILGYVEEVWVAFKDNPSLFT